MPLPLQQNTAAALCPDGFVRLKRRCPSTLLSRWRHPLLAARTRAGRLPRRCRRSGTRSRDSRSRARPRVSAGRAAPTTSGRLASSAGATAGLSPSCASPGARGPGIAPKPRAKAVSRCRVCRQYGEASLLLLFLPRLRMALVQCVPATLPPRTPCLRPLFLQPLFLRRCATRPPLQSRACVQHAPSTPLLPPLPLLSPRPMTASATAAARAMMATARAALTCSLCAGTHGCVTALRRNSSS